MRLALVISIVYLLVGSIYAQSDALSIEDALEQVYQKSLEIPESDYNIPWLEEINVRSGTRDWELRQQRYSLRITPVSWRERTASRKLYEAWKSELDLVRSAPQVEAAEQIHRSWIALSFINQEKINYATQIMFLEDQQKVLSKEVAENTLLLSNLLTVRSEITSINLKIQSLESKIKSIQDRVKELTGLDASLEFNAIDAKKYIDATYRALSTIAEPIVSSERLLEIETIERKIDLEKAEESKVLDFVQLQYQGPHDDLINERISLSMSFNIPYRPSQRLSVAKLQVEKELELLKINLKKEEDTREVNELKRKMILDIEKYQKVKEISWLDQKDRKTLIGNLKTQSIINPRIILENEIKDLKQSLNLLSLQEEIVENYLDYQAWIGVYDSLDRLRVALITD